MQRIFDKGILYGLNNNLGGYSFGETADGKPGYRKPGADTVIPFSNGNFEITVRQRTQLTINGARYQDAAQTNVFRFENFVLKSTKTTEKITGTGYDGWSAIPLQLSIVDIKKL